MDAYSVFDLICKHFDSPISTPRIRKEPKSIAMLARPFAGELPVSYACEPKIDGVRVIVTADLDAKTVSFITRNGNELPSLAHLAPSVLAMFAGHAGIRMLDAEAVCGSSFFDSVGAIRKKTKADDASLWLFDLPDHAGTYAERRAELESIWMACGEVPSLRLIPSYRDMTPHAAFRLFTSAGFEGVMVKDRSATYAKGRRSSAWMKMKDSDTADCEIIDIVEGTGKCRGMAGAIIVRHGLRKVRVGTGMNDITRKTLLDERSQLIGKTAEVNFHMQTPDGSLRHPSFVCIRGDK